MPVIKLGSKTIKYEIENNHSLKHCYIKLKDKETVVVRGKNLSNSKAQLIILKKSKWILNKLQLISFDRKIELKNGMTTPFLGSNLVVFVEFGGKKNIKGEIKSDKIYFNLQESEKDRLTQWLPLLLENFYRFKAHELIPQRLDYWSKRTGHKYSDLKFRKLKRKWGSCSSTNCITINIFALKLRPELIDYLLIHELCHVKEKNHGKNFWKEVEKFSSNYKLLDREIKHAKI